MSDGFWGALVGALTTGTAGIIVICIQLNQEKKRAELASKREIKYAVYYLNKYVDELNKLIEIYQTINENDDKIKGYKMVGVNEYELPMYGAAKKNDDETLEFLDSHNKDLQDLIIPKIVKLMIAYEKKFKKINLSLVKYEVFKHVLDSIETVELIEHEMGKNNVAVLQTLKNTLENYINKLKVYK